MLRECAVSLSFVYLSGLLQIQIQNAAVSRLWEVWAFCQDVKFEKFLGLEPPVTRYCHCETYCDLVIDPHIV